MMKRLIFALLSLYSSMVLAQAQDNRTYYPSGKLESEFKVNATDNSKRNTTYFESGKVSGVQNYSYRDGHFRSENIHYYESGHVAVHSIYEDGIPIGRVYAEYPDGKLSYEHFFNDGYKTGSWKSFNPDGSLKEETSFTGAPVRWDDDDINATTRYYYIRELAYTVVYTAGRAGKPQIANQEAYKKLTAAPPVTGEKLFMQHCSMCHTKKSDVIAPNLDGIGKRRSEDWLRKMIVNGQQLIEAGDQDALQLFKKMANSASQIRAADRRRTAFIDPVYKGTKMSCHSKKQSRLNVSNGIVFFMLFSVKT